MTDGNGKDALHEVRRAAFELRDSDRDEAVRVLRRVAAQEGEAAVLAHGALAEIYLDDFGDLDGAEHEFRAVLAAAPGLSAAELGLARTLRLAGRYAESRAHFGRAIAGLSTQLVEARTAIAANAEPAVGAEEAALTLLEAAIERADLLEEAPLNPGEKMIALDESLLDWAEKARLFDAVSEEGENDHSDWQRYVALRARLLALGGETERALTLARTAAANGDVEPVEAIRVESEVLQAAEDLAGAAAAAQRALSMVAVERWEPEEVLRAHALLTGTNDDAGARALMERARGSVTARLVVATGDERERLQDALSRYDSAARQGTTLVTLGKPRSV